MILPADGGLKIHCLPLGELSTNCWVLAVEGTGEERSACWVVDPDEDTPLAEFLEKKRYAPQRLVVTHGHGDHIGGITGLKQRYPQAIITAPVGDAHMLTDAMANLSAIFGVGVTAPPAEETVRGGDELTLGHLTWKVLDLSGHTSGGVGFYCQQAGVVVVGDALFADSIGRTDFPGCSHAHLIANIHKNLMSLSDATRVLSGHGAPTTIGQERRSNPFLQPE